MKTVFASLLLISSFGYANDSTELRNHNVIASRDAYAKILLGTGPLTEVEDREEFSRSERHGFTPTPARLQAKGCIVRDVSFTSKNTGEIRHAVFFMQGENSLILAHDKKANAYYSYDQNNAQIKVDSSGDITELTSNDISCKNIQMEDRLTSLAEKYSCTLLSESDTAQTKADLREFDQIIPNMDITFTEGFAAVDVHYKSHSFRHRFHNRKGILEPRGTSFHYITSTTLQTNKWEVAGSINWDTYNRSPRSSDFEFAFNRRTKQLTAKDIGPGNRRVDAATYQCR